MNARERLAIMVRTDRGSMTIWSPAEVRDALDAHRAEVLAEAANFLAEVGTPITGTRNEHERGLMYGAERLRRMTATDTTTSRCPTCGHLFEGCTCTGTTRAVAEYVTAGKQRLLTAMNTKREDTP